MSITVNFDTKKVAQRLEIQSEKAQKVLDSEVLRGSNYFIPKDTGAMEKSSTLHTVIGSGEVVWKTPYVVEQYYNTGYTHAKSRNPRATAKWFETAKARWEKSWLELVRRFF